MWFDGGKADESSTKDYMEVEEGRKREEMKD